MDLLPDPAPEELADGAAAIARRIVASGRSRIGIAPADRSSKIDDVVDAIAIALQRLTGRDVAAVRATALGPGDGGWDVDRSTGVSVFSPRQPRRPDQVIAALDELLASSVGDQLTVVDLSGLEAAGLLQSAAGLLDAYCVVAHADWTRDRDLERMTASLPGDGFLGVVLVAGALER